MLRIATYRRKTPQAAAFEVGFVSDDGTTIRPLELEARQRGAAQKR